MTLLKKITMPNLLAVFFTLSSSYYGWLTFHFWNKTLTLQKYGYSVLNETELFLITWLEEMGIICSLMTFVSFTLLLLVMYRFHNLRIVWGDG